MALQPRSIKEQTTQPARNAKMYGERDASGMRSTFRMDVFVWGGMKNGSRQLWVERQNQVDAFWECLP